MKFEIQTLEMFETIVIYEVEADSKEEAIEMVKSGDVAYIYHEHPGNADKFLEVLSTIHVTWSPK